MRTRRAPPGSSLAERAPEIAEEWDHEANGDVTPRTIGAASAFPAHWVCRINSDHRWQQPVQQRARTDHGRQCPLCLIDLRLAARRGTSLDRLADVVAELQFQYSPRNPLAADEASADPSLDWVWRCDADHEFVRSLNDLEKGFACPRCYVRQRRLERVPRSVAIGGVFKSTDGHQRSKEEIRLAAELAQVLR